MNRLDGAGDHAEESAPLVSVVVPVWAAGPEALALLERSLIDVNASSFRDFEVLVADDGSPEGAAVGEIARRAGARLVRLDQRSGPAAARNAAATRARGEILVFLDADASPHTDTLERFVCKLSKDSELDAVIGSYDRMPTAPGLVSRFRNLSHSFVHHQSSAHAHTFWASCGAVRKDRFHMLGGFNTTYTRPSIEDVEFGFRLCAAGGRIELDRDIQVTHHKTWTLSSMIRTDMLARAIPWAELLHRHPLPWDLNFKIRDRVSCALAALIPMAAWMALKYGLLWVWAPFAVLALIGALNLSLFRYLAEAIGLGRALLCFPLLLTYLGTCVVGLLAGLAKAEHRRDRFFWPACALTGLTLMAVQISGGAFRAEFTGHPDEPAQFVSGLMLYDYLTALPKGNPLTWAGNYYLHYPKVAIGQWPPAYHVAEALWWLVWGPSRASAMWLQWVIGLAALMALYRLCRAFLPLFVTVGIVALTIAAPVFQRSLQETMADLSCLLWSLLFMHAAVRFLEKRDQASLFLLGICLTMAAMTKGTAVCLVPVAIAVVLANRKRVPIPIRWILAAGSGLSAVVAWYALAGNALAWGGISGREPWPGAVVGHLAGWGFVALAALGLRRTSLALVSAGIVMSTLGCSLAVRAMREDRHWIIVLPAILTLAGFAVSRFRRTAFAAAFLVPGLVLFPWSRVRQPQTEFGKLLRQVRLPSRMLVSSVGMGEGPWIAVACLAERRPSSYIVRASKVLAAEGWNGEDYHLLAVSQEAVLRRIDELALDLVILDASPVARPAPHYALLLDALQNSSAWKECGHARNLLAYCRALAPRFPRQPLEMWIRGMDLKETVAEVRR
jgi:glycosyltransferase involved in cell wall biosynthesis